MLLNRSCLLMVLNRSRLLLLNWSCLLMVLNRSCLLMVFALAIHFKVYHKHRHNGSANGKRRLLVLSQRHDITTLHPHFCKIHFLRMMATHACTYSVAISRQYVCSARSY